MSRAWMLAVVGITACTAAPRESSTADTGRANAGGGHDHAELPGGSLATAVRRRDDRGWRGYKQTDMPTGGASSTAR